MYFLDSGKYYKIYKNIDGSMYYFKKRLRFKIEDDDIIHDNKPNPKYRMKNIKRKTRRRKEEIQTHRKLQPVLDSETSSYSSSNSVSNKDILEKIYPFLLKTVNQYIIEKLFLEENDIDFFRKKIEKNMKR